MLDCHLVSFAHYSSIRDLTIFLRDHPAKDRVYTKMFGKASATPKPFPPLSFALFATRDSLTVLAGFTLPPIIAEKLEPSTVGIISRPALDVACQLTVPCLMQFVSAPMHLMGIDLYNRPGKFWNAERSALIRREYWKTAWARVGRIFPAYGVGGVLNKRLRKRLVPKYK
eukprot:Partr_v1_DN26139_c1_g1_i2_m10607 putative Conserved hypothetical protein